MKSQSRLSLLKRLSIGSLFVLSGLSTLFAQTITTTTSNVVTATVSSTVVRDHTSQPLLLGYSTGWLCIQTTSLSNSNLWDSSTMQVRPALTAFLKTDFAGAVYRCGTDYMDWDKTIGPMANRVNQGSSWGGYYPVQFGIDEFLRFVESVQGTPEFFLNMDSIGGVLVDPTNAAQWATLKQKAVGLLEYCNAPVNEDWNGDGIYQGQLRSNYGHAAPYNVMIWELGNEEDGGKGIYTSGFYTKEQYAARCQELIAALKAHQPNLAIIAHARTAPWGDVNWRNWHNTLLASTGASLSGVVWHPYYDGYDITTIGNYTSAIWTDANTWATGAGSSSVPGVCITEHGVWPSGTASSYSAACTSINGAISGMDMIISNEAKPFVQMALNHSLTACSAWSEFTQVDASGENYVWNTTFAPRPFAYALKLAHRLLANADILTTSVVSPKTTSYNYPYDVRAVGYKYGSSGVMGTMFINRSDANTYPVTMTLPGWTTGATSNVIVRLDGIGGPDGNDSPLWQRYVAASVNTSSQAILKLPYKSIVSMQTIGQDVALNGSFELGTLGSVPTYWQAYVDTTSTTIQLVADSSNTASKAKILRMQKSVSTPGSCSIVQPAWTNTALASTGTIGQNLNDTYVLRANVRTTSLSANTAWLKAQCFNAAGTYVEASPYSPGIPANTSGKWTPVALEFVPANIVGTAGFNRMEIVLLNTSPTGTLDVDCLTLQRRKNWVQYPVIQDSDSNGLADGWENRMGTGAGTMTYTAGTPAFVRMTKTGSAGMQFVQTFTDSSALNARIHEKWRLKARVRYSGLNASGAQLKVQCFDSAWAYYGSSPLGTAFTGTSSDWVEKTLEFNLRDVLGAAKFGHAEIMIQNNSTSGYVDVCFMSLEAVD